MTVWELFGWEGPLTHRRWLVLEQHLLAMARAKAGKPAYQGTWQEDLRRAGWPEGTFGGMLKEVGGAKLVNAISKDKAKELEQIEAKDPLAAARERRRLARELAELKGKV